MGPDTFVVSWGCYLWLIAIKFYFSSDCMFCDIWLACASKLCLTGSVFACGIKLLASKVKSVSRIVEAGDSVFYLPDIRVELAKPNQFRTAPKLAR